MRDTGIIEIDGKRNAVAREDIRKLKSILEELGIMHIADDVSFCSTIRAAGQIEDIQNVRLSRTENDDGVLPEYRCGCGEKPRFRELIIPDFFLIDFVSLTQLDNDEAEFIGNLIYGTEF